MRSFSFYSMQLILWLIFFGASIASSWSPSSRVSALYWYHKNYGFVYVININTYDIFFCLYEYAFQNTTGKLLLSQQVSATLWNINITVWLQSQVYRVTYYFVLMHDIFTSQNTGTHYTFLLLSHRVGSSEPRVVKRF